MRAILLRLSSRDHVLMMILHHLIFDGWSRAVLFRELTMFFMAFSANVRLTLITGVMGGFTTYSTFNYETTNYFREGAWLMGATNMAATLVGCLAAGLAGLALARLVVR